MVFNATFNNLEIRVMVFNATFKNFSVIYSDAIH